MSEGTVALDQRSTRPVRSAPGDGVVADRAAFEEWWAARHRSGRFHVTRIPFTGFDAWGFDGVTGNLAHRSGRFFTVEGVRVEAGGRARSAQPIINQPEIGVLGILVREIDGVVHCLMQAKMEPGNVNTLQLSPTVQATRSNYTQVHQGKGTRHLDRFVGPRRGEVLVDVLQSEQGAWFWRKRNRNIIVRVTDEVPVTDDYRWLPLPLVQELMAVPNLVNMDARTVLSCLPLMPGWPPAAPAPDSFAAALARSYGPFAGRAEPSTHQTLAEISSWFIEAKTRCDWSARLVPLAEVAGWSRTDDEIVHDEGRLFRIVAVGVEAGNREVTRWTQPLLDPGGQGLVVLVVRPIRGVLHLLVRARPEVGLLDLVEMGSTVQLAPGEDPSTVEEPHLQAVAAGRLGRERYDVVLSEEGGRFHRALNRYRLVEVGDEFPVDVPADHCWMTMSQVLTLLRHGHHLNIEARSLLACLHSLL